MDSTPSDGIFVEEREELMVFPSERNNRPMRKNAHLLKPHVTTIDGSEAILRPAPSPDLKASSLCVSFSGWRLPNQKFKSWARKMAALHKPTWVKSGIFEAIKASTYKIHKNPSLILSLAQKWSPETKSFVFPWGEATITLEDVTVLLGFSVLGSSVYAPLESSEIKESVEKLEKQRQESVKQVTWISSFVDDQMEHEAFLVLWLSNFVFPDKTGRSISKEVFPIAVRLARGERIALAPAVLASLYRDLGKIHASASTRNVYLKSLFKLVQVWIWERFKSIRPEAKVLIPKGEPRIAQWSGLKQRTENVGLFLFDDFDWRPYTKPLSNWNPPRFYNEEAKRARINDDRTDDEFGTFARCVRVSKLDGLGFVEDYYPNRVAMQFGLAQDPPGSVTNHGSKCTEKEAREGYNRPLDGSKQYIPPRRTTAFVTAARYRDWWINEMLKEPAENMNESNTVYHYGDGDDDDVSPKVLLLSQVFQKLGDGMKKTEQLTNKRRKRAREDDNESAMDCCRKQDEEEDDNITVAQIIKSRKTCGDLKDRSRLEVDYNVSGLPQKLASIEEHNSSDPYVASNGVAEKEVDDGNITIAQVISSRNKCGDLKDRSRLDVDYNVSGLPQKLASGDEHNSSDPYVASNGVAEKEVDDGNITIAQVIRPRKLCGNVENSDGGGDAYGRHEVDYNVPDLAQKLPCGDETVTTPEEKDENNSSYPLVASNGIAEKEAEEAEDDVIDDERLKQRKLAIDELALNLEARMLEMEKTLAKIKQCGR